MRRDDDESLSSSVLDYPEEFGRTYHAYHAGCKTPRPYSSLSPAQTDNDCSAYVYPNDLTEQERLALQGPIIKRLFDDRLYFAPLSRSDPPQFILDIATGVGDWAVEMGDLFPSSRIVGTDLSPIQPDMVPPNVEFYVEDS